MSEIYGEGLEFDMGDGEVIAFRREAPALDVWFLGNPAPDTSAEGWKNKYLGDCTVFRVGGKVGILDIGNESDAVTLRAFLKAHGLTQIDVIILSHYHADHIGNVGGAGLSALLADEDLTFTGCRAYLPHKNIDWERGGSSLTFTANYATVQNTVKEILTAAGVTIVEPAAEGATYPVGAAARLKFYNLSAQKFASYYTNAEWGEKAYISAGDALENKISYNNFCMITELHHAGRVFLFPGDLERPGQAQNAADISVPDVYRVEHHALNLRTDKAWLEKVHPRIAVIGELYPVGNDYARDRLVPPTVLDTFRGGGAVYDTNYSGTVHIQSKSTELLQSAETGALHTVNYPIFNQAVPQAQNIDELKTPGFYYTVNAAHTATLTGDIPTDMTGAGLMIAVLKGRGDTTQRQIGTVQVIRKTEGTAALQPAIYVRHWIGASNVWDSWSRYAALPAVTADDNGKVLGVVDGKYALVTT